METKNTEDASGGNDFAKFHLKQCLVLIVVYMIAWKVLVYSFVGIVFLPLLWFVTAVFSIMEIVNILTKKEKPLPLIGGLASILAF